MSPMLGMCVGPQPLFDHSVGLEMEARIEFDLNRGYKLTIKVQNGGPDIEDTEAHH